MVLRLIQQRTTVAGSNIKKSIDLHITSLRNNAHESGRSQIHAPFLCPNFVLFSVAHSCYRLVKIVSNCTSSCFSMGLVLFQFSSGLVWSSNGRFLSGCQMVWYSNGGLKAGLKKPVYGPKCPVFE